ncbi:unnamed protein product [Cylicocyclus nassatus]|uniref:C2H2-type domain-containing protein n=1 Tax=Cylicocyclus nassatus TaxID=53992 RepID=A0AA36GYP4_CYLNA|nr:unnamed protein product [Cylicocyclus nassatus]
MIHSDDGGLDLDCPGPSSSTILPQSSGSPSNISGWDELMEFYDTKSSKGRRSKKSSTLPENKVSKNTHSGRTSTCPLCAYHVRSGWSQNSEQTLAKMVKHLRSHEGELDSSQKVACTLCYNFCSKSELHKHYRECHGEQPEQFIESEVLYFTNSVHRQQGLINTYTQALKRNSLADKRCIPADSLFRGYPTKRSIESCRSLWRRKFETSSHPKFLFRFKIRPSSSAPITWACPLCTSSSVCGCSSFSNDISARLFILRHFSILHHDLENLATKVQQEWEILTNEVGFDLKPHAVSSAELLQQKERSCHFYVLRTLEDRYRLLQEMIARCVYKKELSTSEYSICAVCFIPVPTRSLFRHFSTGEHRKMNVHDGLSEFREVPEIAESPTTTAVNFPYLSLRYSKVFKIKELGDADSMTFLKWRCCLASEIAGHVDDVLEFPTVQILKVHALKHFQTFHVDFFDNSFLAYEWALLKRELPSSECARYYSPLKRSPDEGPFDITDPNHFHAPNNMRLLPKYLVDIQVCGFCFWCGYSSQFLDHIVCHGYIDTGHGLSSCTRKEFFTLSGSRLSRKMGHLDHVESLIPNKILGSVGEEALSSIITPKHRTSQEDSNVIYTTPRSSIEASACQQKMLNPSSTASRSMVPAGKSPLKVSFPNEEYFTANSSVYDNDESDTSSIASSMNDFSISENAQIESGVQSSLPDAQSSMVPTSTTDTHSEQIFQDVSSYKTDDDEDDVRETANHVGTSSIAEEHKVNILEKFTWEGPPPPPLDVDQTEQLMMLSRNECPFCKTAHGSRGLRVPAFANDEIKEECMIAHMVRFHHEDGRAKWVFEAKRYRMSTSKRANPLKFLLEPSQEGYLVCSSCEKASFPKLANLRPHWVRCVEVGGKYRKDLRLGRSVLMSPAALVLRKRRSVNSPVRCPVKGCLSAWRPSHIYPNSVGQIAHMLARHLTDKDAYDIALELGEKEQLDKVFPYLSVSKSFAKTLSHPKTMCLQCSKCEHGVRRPNELVQHAQRYHPTEEHYSGAPKCPFECGRKIKRRPDLSDKVLRLIHMFRYHLGTDKAVEWIRDWSRSNSDVMDSEPIYRFDVLASLEKSLFLASPKIKCSFCENWYCLEMYLKEHRKPRSPCYRRTLAENEDANTSAQANKSSQEISLLSISKRRKLRQCEFCSRAVTQSTNYSERVSKFLHALHVHLQSAPAVQWLDSRDYYSYVCEFPYLDIVTTLETSRKRGKTSLHCAICSYETDATRRIINHAILHQELMHHEDSYTDPCSICGEQIQIYSQVKEPFQRLCHLLAKHSDNKDLVRDAIDAYSCDNESPVLLMDCQRTLEMFLEGENRIACGRCDFSSSNGYALIEHAKTHDITVAKQNRREIKRKLPIVCPYCKRMLLCSARYSHRVTLFIHFVKFHRMTKEDVEDFISKCAAWNLAQEFPYIDAAASIRIGKLQCAICEASLPDTAQILKHATIVHEGYQPHFVAKEVTTDAGKGDLIVTQLGSDNMQVPASLVSSEMFNDEKVFSNFSLPSEAIVSAVPPSELASQETEFGTNLESTHSAEGEDEALFTAITPKKEFLSNSGQRLSRTYAPMNDRVPLLPSSSDDEIIREGGRSVNTGLDDPYSQRGSARDEQENHEEAACAAKQQGICSNTDISGRNINAAFRLDVTSLPGPSTSTPKPNRTSTLPDSQSSLLSWLSPINGSIVPSRRAELISESQDGRDLRDALDNIDTRHGNVVKRKRSHHSSSDGTLFDELPQRMVQKIALKSKPPDDISHIKGAKGHPCNFCEFKARSVSDIRRHTSIAHSEILPSNSTNIVTPCHLCNEVFEKRTLLLKHITDSHAELQQPFKCAYCPKTYVTSLRMREHERRCHESRLFVDAASLICPLCDKEFSSKRNRDQHVKRHKNPNSSLARGF